VVAAIVVAVVAPVAVAGDRGRIATSSWSTPVTVGHTWRAGFGSAPVGAVNDRGAAVVAWVTSRATGKRDRDGRMIFTPVVEAAYRPAGERFDRAQRMVPEVKRYFANYPRPVVAINPAGAAVVIWATSPSRPRVEDPAYSLHAAVRPAGARRFGRARTLAVGADGNRGERPAVVARPDGRFLAVWQREQRDGFGVFRAVRIEAAGASRAGRWSAPVALATAALPEQLGAPAAAVTGTGDVAVAWVRFGGDPAVPDAAMQVTVKPAHGRFTPAQTLAVPGELATDQFGPAVAAGPGGRAAVSWHSRLPDSRSHIVVAYRSEDGLFATPVPVSSLGGGLDPTSGISSGRPGPPTAVFDSLGRLNVLWPNFGYDDTCTPVRLDLATETSPGALSTPEALDVVNPSLASVAPDSRGNLLAAWFVDGETNSSALGCTYVNRRPRLATLSRARPTVVAPLTPPRLGALEADTAAMLSSSPRGGRVIGIWQVAARRAPPDSDQGVAIRVADYLSGRAE
jgi:hypothetical protein